MFIKITKNICFLLKKKKKKFLYIKKKKYIRIILNKIRNFYKV
ncbi:hypothetical protein ACT2CC_00090 [Candidatus Vidania fulgoroideorum]